MSYIEPLLHISPKRNVRVPDKLRGRFVEASNDYSRARQLNGTVASDIANTLNEAMPLMGLAKERDAPLTDEKIASYLHYHADNPSPPESVVKAMEIVADGFLDHHGLLDVWQDAGLIDEEFRVFDQARLNKTLSAWRERYGLSQAALGEQSQVNREVICKLENGKTNSDSNFRTLSNLADFFDVKWRLEPHKSKDYVPGSSILARWQDKMAEGVAFKDVLKQEMQAHDIKSQKFALPLFAREIINRYLNAPASKAPPSLACQAALARIFERLEMQKEYGIEIPGLLGESIAESKAPPENALAQVQHEGVCEGKGNSRRR